MLTYIYIYIYELLIRVSRAIKTNPHSQMAFPLLNFSLLDQGPKRLH